MSLTRPLQILSITTALLASGGILTLSVFDIPEIQSQPASRSLPMTRWLFSRGSHIFPTASFITSAGFASLAWTALPLALRAGPRSILNLFKLGSNSAKVNGYLAAAILTFSIAPWTTIAMISTNFRLIELNEQLGGARSARAAKESKHSGDKPRTIHESIDGKGMPSQWTDLSGPQTKTEKEATKEQEVEVQKLLSKFARLNTVRAVLMGIGGVVGLWAALA